MDDTTNYQREVNSYFFISFCCRCVTRPFSESGRKNGFRMILRYRNGQISMPTKLVLVARMAMILNM